MGSDQPVADISDQELLRLLKQAASDLRVKAWIVGGYVRDVLLERRETRAMVRRCIDRLPERYRTVLLLRDIEELDTQESADLLGTTPNTVKIRLHRARQALRTLLEREFVRA